MTPKYIVVCKHSSCWEIHKLYILPIADAYYMLFAACNNASYAHEIVKALNK